jgi:hypothetical protein
LGLLTMKNSQKIFFLALILVIAWLQSNPTFAIYGVKPNLVMAFLGALAVFTSQFFFFIIIIILANLVLQNLFFFSWESIVFILLLALGFFLVRRLPWRTLINITALIILITLGLYLVIEPMFVFNNPRIVFLELIFNILFASLFYLLMSYVTGRHDSHE